MVNNLFVNYYHFVGIKLGISVNPVIMVIYLDVSIVTFLLDMFVKVKLGNNHNARNVEIEKSRIYKSVIMGINKDV